MRSGRLGAVAVSLVALLTLDVAPVALAHEQDWPVERRGAASNNAWAIQYLLWSHGFELAIDGVFGPETEAKVRDFQRSTGLKVDGVAGGATWTKLTGFVARQGSRGDHVSAMQSRLSANGYDVCIDGIFGPKTDAAVRRFQQDNGLLVDGIVGHQTWHELAGRITDPEYPAGPHVPCG